MEVQTLTELVKERLSNPDRPLGALSQRQISWLLAFTKYLFHCPRSEIGISTEIPLILLAPVMNKTGDSEFMNQEQFDAAVETFNVLFHQQGLPKAMDLPAYRIEFTRKIHAEEEKR